MNEFLGCRRSHVYLVEDIMAEGRGVEMCRPPEAWLCGVGSLACGGRSQVWTRARFDTTALGHVTEFSLRAGARAAVPLPRIHHGSSPAMGNLKPRCTIFRSSCTTKNIALHSERGPGTTPWWPGIGLVCRKRERTFDRMRPEAALKPSLERPLNYGARSFHCPKRTRARERMHQLSNWSF